MELEQRKLTRQSIKNNVFAALRGGFKKVGKINDISLKGLGFSYLRQNDDAGSYDRDLKVDIIVPESGVHLFNLPCRIVYDKTDDTTVEGLPVMKSRCGLHFGKLSHIQLNLLNFIIAKQTNKRRANTNAALNYPFNMT